MTDIGETPLGFLKHSQEFFAAADLVLSKTEEVSLPAYFLLGRSIELSLKAFLLHCGKPITELRKPNKFGHNLEALLDASVEHGIEEHISIAPVEIGVIRLLSYDYADKRFEYRITGGTYHLPLIDVTWHICRTLAFDLESVLGS
ncbi:hypothetical protein [Pseudomonas sediminis]|uniref:HEPN domain-containing protein n=1 Tax=Pseudomonas sediminis TaxID=1691904 RepID=A0ABX6SJE1_9PSED|nr:hypothetical protein [Pseudomonas sediminis]QNH01929.1 hypothetical protein HNQ25_04105 [Pseudomonas sediminis]